LYFYVRYNFAAFYSLKKFWQCFIVGAALQSAVAVGQFLTQHSLGLKFFAESPLSPDLAGVAKIVVDGEKIIRAYGLVPHPNILAAMLMVALFGLVWLFINSSLLPERSPVQRDGVEGQNPSTRYARSGSKWGKGLFLMSIFFLLSAALFFTFSRGVIIVGGVLFLAWLAYLWCDAMNRRAILGIFLLFAICYSFLAIIYWPYISSRYDLTSLPESQSVALRSFYNQKAIKMIWQAPLLGVGQGNFTTALRRVVSLPDWQYQPAHNIYLLVATENGPLALLAFLAFLFFTLKSAWQYRKKLSASCLLFIIGCLLLIGFFDHFLWDLQQGQILFWLMLGILSSTGLRSSAD
ncbi:O-antigen ligase family protein, partial [Patescibacteria group bacterium]|nr:O-antigen ligase family protein [Patescibacteria group bacterium]